MVAAGNRADAGGLLTPYFIGTNRTGIDSRWRGAAVHFVHDHDALPVGPDRRDEPARVAKLIDQHGRELRR